MELLVEHGVGPFDSRERLKAEARSCVTVRSGLLRVPGSDRSTAYPVAQVKHPVALNHHVRILQQVLRVDRPEVALASPEHDGHDVHAHLVDQARGKHLATDVAGGDLDEVRRLNPDLQTFDQWLAANGHTIPRD